MNREALYRRALGLPEPLAMVDDVPVGGSWIHLDGGTLDLGLVRDSQLQGVSDYEIFGEVFEGVAFVNGGDGA